MHNQPDNHLAIIPKDIAAILTIRRDKSIPTISSILPKSSPTSTNQIDQTLPSLDPIPILDSLPQVPPSNPDDSLPLLLSLISLADSGIMSDKGVVIQHRIQDQLGARIDQTREQLEGIQSGLGEGIQSLN